MHKERSHDDHSAPAAPLDARMLRDATQGPAGWMVSRRAFAVALASGAFSAAAAPAFAGDAEGAAAEGAEDADAPAEDADATEDAAEADAAETDTDTSIVTVDEDGNTHIINTFADRIDELAFEPAATYTLPLGSVVRVDSPNRAAVVQSLDEIGPLTVVGCLDFSTGDYYAAVPEPLAGSNYSPSEARCSDDVIAWVEIDNANDSWAFYAAPFDGTPVGLGSAGLVKLCDADSEWLPPQFAVYGRSVIWQLMPDPSGSHVTDSSLAYRWTVGSSAGEKIAESPGRFACEPNVSAGVLTIVPRVRASEGVYYQIQAYDLDRSMALLDTCDLPVSVKPLFATHVGNDFAFSIEANYGYGGLLGEMGYYIGPGSGPFDYVAREPSAQVSYVGGRYIVKSLVSYFAIDTVGRDYARISSANRCTDYGDYPATAGSVSRFVTYATVKESTTGIPQSVIVRIFTLV